MENTLNNSIKLKSETSDVEVMSWKNFFIDRLGICLSMICVAHCILTPFALILLPSFAYLFHDERFHLGLVIILPLVALLAFIPGYRTHHDKRVIAWGIVGIALISAAVFVFHSSIWMEALVSISGSACLIRAHILNRFMCVCCEVGHGPARFKSKRTDFKAVSLSRPKPRLMRAPTPHKNRK